MKSANMTVSPGVFPPDTIVQFNFLPTLRAQLALIRNESSKAIGFLQVAGPYELGNVGYAALYPVVTRSTTDFRSLGAH